MRCLYTLTLMLLAAVAPAQFRSGSTGADGALSFPPGDGSPRVVDFDPASFNPPLDADGDGVYHLTTVSIPPNVTVRLRADRCGWRPLFWLCSGPVQILGTLDLSGEAPREIPYGQLTPVTIPGPGGFPGGVAESAPDQPAQPGLGPGGGEFPRQSGTHATQGFLAWDTPLYGNPFLVPLLGGSGGAGSPRNNSVSDRLDTVMSGGAGGGAILIASDMSIQVDGAILALGGDLPNGREGGGFTQAYLSGSGSGGAIRLIAPEISGAGRIAAGRDPLDFTLTPGGHGRVRLESGSDNFSGVLFGVVRRVSLLPTTPLGLPGTVPHPTLRLTAMNGAPLPARPAALFSAADVEIDTAEPVTLGIEARHVPPGTIVRVLLLNETSYVATVDSGPLVGTLELSTASITVNVDQGFSRVLAHALWSPP
jgi:hypothetical protein